MKIKKHSNIAVIILNLVVLLTSESLANNTNEEQEQLKSAPSLVQELDQKRSQLMDRINPIQRERSP